MSSTAVATRTAMQEVCAAVAAPDFKAKIRSAAGTGNAEVERFTRVALTALQLTPDLVTVKDRGSIMLSLSRCAADGLLPDGREAALVKVGDKVAYWPMIGGVRKMAAEYGFSLVANVVYSGDEFDYQLGLDPRVTHKPPKLDIERGNPIGAYAIAQHEDHGLFLEVMNHQEIEHVRTSSKAGTSGPWKSHWGEMARKTVARRLFKQLPLGAISDRHASILAADDDAHDFSSPLDDLPVINVADKKQNDDEVMEGEVYEPEDAA
jgi:recombination protein RecT